MQERRAVAVSVLCLENVLNDIEYLVLCYGRAKSRSVSVQPEDDADVYLFIRSFLAISVQS